MRDQLITSQNWSRYWLEAELAIDQNYDAIWSDWATMHLKMELDMRIVIQYHYHFELTEVLFNERYEINVYVGLIKYQVPYVRRHFYTYVSLYQSRIKCPPYASQCFMNCIILPCILKISSLIFAYCLIFKSYIYIFQSSCHHSLLRDISGRAASSNPNKHGLMCRTGRRSVKCTPHRADTDRFWHITVYPKKYAHGFVVLCFVVVMQSFIMNSHEVFIHIHQGCFAGTGAIVRLPQCQWSKPDGYGKISQCITTTKHSKAKTVCIFLGIYWTSCLHSWRTPLTYFGK